MSETLNSEVAKSADECARPTARMRVEARTRWSRFSAAASTGHAAARTKSPQMASR